MLTTHDLRDIEEICPRLLVIDRGHLLWDGAVADLKARFGQARTLTVEFEGDPGAVFLPSAELMRDEGRRKTFRFDRGATGAPALLAALMSRYPVADAAVAEADIEDVIRDLYVTLERSRPAEDDEIDTWTRSRAVIQ